MDAAKPAEISEGLRHLILNLAAEDLAPSAIAWRLHRMGMPGHGPDVRAVLRGSNQVPRRARRIR